MLKASLAGTGRSSEPANEMAVTSRNAPSPPATSPPRFIDTWMCHWTPPTSIPVVALATWSKKANPSRNCSKQPRVIELETPK